jgi:PPOX class probable F420-dependent enzyme
VRLPEDEARARFTAARVARLATADAQGRPHLVPVTFATEGDSIYVAVDRKPKSTTALKRLSNIAENPHVAMLVDHYDDDWDTLWWVRADGTARILGTDTAAPLRLLAARYRQYQAASPPGPVLAIQVARWSGWAASP